MRHVQPDVFVVAKTHIDDGMLEYLASIGRGDWKTDTELDGDRLTEFAGRTCYRSWGVHDAEIDPDGTNPNVVRVREGNQEYVGNIIKQIHGSVLEHASISIMFKNFSRVFSHELVRHRAGMAYSQESMRFIRLTDLGFWLPPESPDFVEQAFHDVFSYVEGVQHRLIHKLGIDKMSMSDKKKWTSRLRRLVPQGVATSILATGNLRAWRHIHTMRSSPGAEEEMRLAMDLLLPIFQQLAPASFSELGRFPRGI